MSVLYFDIEWYSETEDPTAEERLAIIKKAITACLPRKCQIIGERLSRPDPKSGWKNSWHLYTDVTFQHNAQGCMRAFVHNKVWRRIKDEPLMWCSATNKPILDLTVYTKNRCLRVPGSAKRPKQPGTQPLPLPTLQLFMQSRMADRPGPPTYTTDELNRWKCLPAPHTETNTPRKRDLRHCNNLQTAHRRTTPTAPSGRKANSRKRSLRRAIPSKTTNERHV